MESLEKPVYGIRGCTLSEIQNVMSINEATLPENYPIFFYEQILERYPEAFKLAYLIDDPDTIIGYIMWRVERGPSSFGLKYVKKGHLVSLAVLKQYRRQGVASMLLNHSMEAVQQFKISEYVLEVRVSNTGAVRLYEDTLGFEKIRIVDHYYKDGEDAFYMSYKYAPKGNYQRGSHSMSDQEIYSYYEKKKEEYLCYQCPQCEKLIMKSKKYSFPGSVHPKNPSKKTCPYCGYSFSLYELSMGTYDFN